MHFFKSLYIFFIVLALNLFFFSTTNLIAKAFQIEEIEISEPFSNNFNKNAVINKGFRKAFFKLINSLVKSSDFNKVKAIKLKEIQGMIESFSIKEEKFVDQTYYVNLGVSFEKKQVFKYLEKKNIFPAQIIKETFLFIPIIVDQESEDVFIFSKNPIYKKWNISNKNAYLINYLLPTEDLEDLNSIKSKSNNIENYDFKEIIEKYFLDHSIISLIFKKDKEVIVLSKINIKDETIIKNNSFKNFSFEDNDKLEVLINKLKIIYDDLWKEYNQINTSIKLPLIIKINSKDLNKSLLFEKFLQEVDLISDYSINKFNKSFIYYEVVFNGTPKQFINIMSNKNYNFDTQKKIWVLR
ncbi:hypothetical protein OAQ48_01510 [Candidatus Pelagibacter sp.]|jgi:hypothetical protein|nr:hypothetical protein [Candidatus Pelagibacter sp.]